MRGGGLLIVSVVLFIIFFLSGIFLVLSLSLKYDNVEREFTSIAKNLTQNKFNPITEDFNLTKEINKIKTPMSEYCKNNSEYLFTSKDYNFTLQCSSLEKIDENPEILFDEGISKIIHSTYYANYSDCNFWNCLSKKNVSVLKKEMPIMKNNGMLVLISDKARIYWQEKFYYSLIVLLILILIVFLLVEQKQNALIIIGILTALSSFALSKIEKIMESFAGNYNVFLNLFFGKTGMVFKTMLILGIILILVGIVLKFAYWDYLKKKLSKKDVAEIVKKEIDKKKTEKKKIPFSGFIGEKNDTTKKIVDKNVINKDKINVKKSK